MFRFPLSALPMTKPIPRTESLPVQQLAGIQDELRDIRRVHTQGQEEDLRMALSRTITRIEELSSILIEQYKVQTETQTELTMCKSNLQLALANNEMLEDALKRDTAGRGKDVGWRRQPSVVEDHRSPAAKSLDTDRPSLESSPVLPSTPEPPTGSDSRFFKFRFGTVQNGVHPSHLSSASLPTLLPSKEKELGELTLELERERKARKEVLDEKKKLEEELESLSQALFEEANNMVASERMKLAEAEAELREVRDEKAALRSALQLVENENGRYRQVLSSGDPVVDPSPPSPRGRSHSRANTLPAGGSFPTFRPSSPPPRPKSSLSVRSPSSSLSSSSDPSYATPSPGPIEYDPDELSPWAGAQSAGSPPTSTCLQPSRSSSVNLSRSIPPPSLDVPPWSAAISAPTRLLTPKTSLLPYGKPSQDGSSVVPNSLSTNISSSVEASNISAALHHAPPHSQ